MFGKLDTWRIKTMHQAYIENVPKRFYMGKPHSLYTPMIIKSLDMNYDSFRSWENDKELLGL